MIFNKSFILTWYNFDIGLILVNRDPDIAFILTQDGCPKPYWASSWPNMTLISAPSWPWCWSKVIGQDSCLKPYWPSSWPDMAQHGCDIGPNMALILANEDPNIVCILYQDDLSLASQSHVDLRLGPYNFDVGDIMALIWPMRIITWLSFSPKMAARSHIDLRFGPLWLC